jgi:hypothetical protein
MPGAAPLLEHVADVRVRVAAPTVVSSSRRVIGITGGEVVGPRLRGKVLPGGADFQVIRADRTTELEARYVIEAESGALIYVINTGFRHGPPEAMERLLRGEAVDPALIYFRSTPRFETDVAEYQWLTKNVFVGTAVRRPDAVELAIFQVL